LPIDDILDDPTRNEDFESPDERRPQRLLDSRRQADGELSDSDDEGEGGRRNHARHHEHDSTSRSSGNEGSGGRMFGKGVGIMTSGSTTTHGAGPSGHSILGRILSMNLVEPSNMDIDKPVESEAASEPQPEPEVSKPSTGSDEMVVDGSSGSNP
jgi:histone deacetylase 1/2